MVGPGWAELAAAVGASSVVVGLIVGQDAAQVAFAKEKMSIRSVISVRAVSTDLAAWAFARGLRGGIFTAAMPVLASTASKDAANCPARSR